MRNGGRVRLHKGDQVPTLNHTLDENTYEWDPHNPFEDGHGTGGGNGNGGGSGGSPKNPFPDTENIPYGATTEEQAETARKQIEEAARGEGLKGEAKIPTPRKLQKGLP